jgi:hypothetical protein
VRGRTGGEGADGTDGPGMVRQPRSVARKEPQVGGKPADLWFLGGAGDGNRTRTISLGNQHGLLADAASAALPWSAPVLRADMTYPQLTGTDRTTVARRQRLGCPGSTTG